MTTPHPLRLCRWTDAQARALSAISRYGADRAFTPAFAVHADMNGQPWRVRMRPYRPEERSGAASRSAVGEVTPGSAEGADSGKGAPGDGMRLVKLDWNGARLSLRMSPRICDDWLAVRLPQLELDDLPGHFIDAAWEVMTADALREFGLAQFCAGIRIVSDGMTAPTATDPAVTVPSVSGPGAACSYAWLLSIQSPDAIRTIDVELAVDEAGLQALADALSQLRPCDLRGLDAPLGALPVPVLAQVGETTLDMMDLRGIQVGDVVLFDCCLATLEGDVRLATLDGQGLYARPCETGASRYVVTQEWSLFMNDGSHEVSDRGADIPADTSFDIGHRDGFDEPFDLPPEDVDDEADGWSCFPSGEDLRPDSTPTSPDSGSADSPGSAGLDVDRIPVRLSFDLGEQRLALCDLRRLRVGEFFDLQRRVDAGPVHIRANGALIGTAELVDIEGRVGARVLTLTLDGHPCR
jgi:type III secretion system YscQ/HrcQ family protein